MGVGKRPVLGGGPSCSCLGSGASNGTPSMITSRFSFGVLCSVWLLVTAWLTFWSIFFSKYIFGHASCIIY